MPAPRASTWVATSSKVDAPVAMLQAVRKVVHEGYSPDDALEVFETFRREFARDRVTA